jgi:sensor histidine kinase regulating citrate/malate metabolism
MKQEHLSDPDMQKATAALIRAAKRARELAQQTGTEFVVIRDGQLVREIPPPVSKKRTKKTAT